MVKIFKKIVHLFKHDWDNREDGFLPPSNIYRTCKMCQLKQRWVLYPLHIGALTDHAMGKWINL